MVIAQMLESGVGVHLRETAVHHADAQAFSVDAFVDEMLSAEALQLVGEKVFCFVIAIRDDKAISTRHFRIASLRSRRRKRSVGNNLLHPRHKRQLGHPGCILVGGTDAKGIQPARLAENLSGISTYGIHVGIVQRIIAEVVKVGTALSITRDGLRVEISVRVELGVVFVGEEHPETLFLCHRHGRNEGKNSQDENFSHKN